MANRPLTTFDFSKLNPAPTRRADYAEMHRIPVRLPGGVTYPKGQVLGEVQVAERNEVQTITIGGTAPTSGSYTLILDGNPAVIPYNATASSMQTLLQAAWGTSSVAVTGTGPFVLTYGGDYQKVNVPLPTIQNNLSAGATVSIVETTSGSPGPVGCYAAYNSGNSDGSQVAKAVLERAVTTDAAGRIVGQFGSFDELTAPAFNGGDWFCADLVGLDAGAVTNLGKLVQGASIATPGAVLRIT